MKEPPSFHREKSIQSYYTLFSGKSPVLFPFFLKFHKRALHGFLFALNDKTDKAKKQFSEILKKLPDHAPTIRSIGNSLQSRGLSEMAQTVYEKGNQLLDGEESFYMDLANLHHSTANYQEAFRYYFMELEKNPKLFSQSTISSFKRASLVVRKFFSLSMSLSALGLRMMSLIRD